MVEEKTKEIQYLKESLVKANFEKITLI